MDIEELLMEFKTLENRGKWRVISGIWNILIEIIMCDIYIYNQLNMYIDHIKWYQKINIINNRKWVDIRTLQYILVRERWGIIIIFWLERYNWTPNKLIYMYF